MKKNNFNRELHELQLFALFQVALREPFNLHWLHKVSLTFDYGIFFSEISREVVKIIEFY